MIPGSSCQCPFVVQLSSQLWLAADPRMCSCTTQPAAQMVHTNICCDVSASHLSNIAAWQLSFSILVCRAQCSFSLPRLNKNTKTVFWVCSTSLKSSVSQYQNVELWRCPTCTHFCLPPSFYFPFSHLYPSQDRGRTSFVSHIISSSFLIPVSTL